MSDLDPRLQKIIEEVQTLRPQKEEPDFVKSLENTSQLMQSLKGKENSQTIELRGIWSTCTVALISAIVLFDMLLVTFYGLDIWSFDKPLIVVAVITDNFLKIVGLGYLIATRIFGEISY